MHDKAKVGRQEVQNSGPVESSAVSWKKLPLEFRPGKEDRKEWPGRGQVELGQLESEILSHLFEGAGAATH